MSPLWKRIRYRLEAWACLLLEWGIPRLSRRACVALGNALGSLAYRFDARGRTVALDNLACAFGSRFTPAERGDVVRASYQNFARTMLDLFWAKRLTPENYSQWIQVEGVDGLAERIASEKCGMVFMCVHQGCWEWTIFCGRFLGIQNVMVVAEDFKNPHLTEIFRRRREHSGQILIGQDSSLLKMLRVVKRGGATGILIDLNLRPSQAATVIEGFGPKGLKMCVPFLHAILAQRAGALLLPVETQPKPDGTCRVIVHPPVEFPEGASHAEIAQRCWDAFEPILRARPAEWLWPYKHFRFRPKMAGRSYPAYSHESGKFEKLMRAQSV